MKQAGSSPRLRGARGGDRRHVPGVRLIPASAGSTLKHPSIVVRRRAHPRVCGEHRDLNAATNLAKGSSPRLRGAPR